MAQAKADLKEVTKFRDSHIAATGGRRPVLLAGVDYLDRFKGVQLKLLAWEGLLTNYPKYRRGHVLVLSYGWMTPAHPDPDAHTLRRVIGFLSNSSHDFDFSGTVDCTWNSHGLFWDFASLPQKDPELFDHAETPEAKADEAERVAFVEDLRLGRKFYGGEETPIYCTGMDTVLSYVTTSQYWFSTAV